ncbi:MAG TPA: FHA domain-containing protein, partial [Gemmatimonadales bacterium]|nr:FHA domain-containing protein [Gemmatimonadales bacterium]
MKAQFKFLSGARSGQVETFSKAYLGLGRHPLSDVRFDAERDLDVSSRHAAIMAKTEGFVLQDLGSKNGTFVNGEKLNADRLLVDGDVIGFGAKGPALEFHVVTGGDDRPTETAAAAEAAAGRLSNPKQVVPATVPPPTRRPPAPRPRSTTAIIAMATAPWRRTATILVGMVVLVVALALYVLWKGAQDRKTELAHIRAWADSVTDQAQRAMLQSDSAVKGLRDELQGSLAEIERLRRQIADAGSDAGTVRTLRGQLEQAQARQQLIVGAGAVEWRIISSRNQDAVALVLVEFSETERFSGTAFAVDSQGTLV